MPHTSVSTTSHDVELAHALLTDLPHDMPGQQMADDEVRLARLADAHLSREAQDVVLHGIHERVKLRHPSMHTPAVIDLREPRQAELFRSIAPGEIIHLPTNYMSERSEPLDVPSLAVESPLGKQARLISLHETDRRLEEFYLETAKARKGMTERLTDMTYEAVIRLLDTSGASGLHHLHNTRFPHTIYFIAKRGNGIQPNLYLTEVARTADKLPVIALLTATKDKRSEYAFFKAVGAGKQKKGYTP